MMTVSETAIEIKNLTKSFGQVKAVDDLSLSVPKGEIFGFLGPNGAGKTTALRLLAGLSKADSGEMFLSGVKVGFGGNTGRERLGYLPDVPECYGFMNTREFLSMCSYLHGSSRSETDRRVGETMELVGLKGVNKRIGSFSRGMKQRVGIAQALIHDPEIVLMDEPVSALDPEGRYDVIEILKKLKGKKTVFLSSHIISDIEKVCDSVAIINKGRLLECGRVSQLRDKYDNMTISFSVPGWAVRDRISDFEEAIVKQSWCEELLESAGNLYRVKVSNRNAAQAEIPGILSSYSIPVESFDSVTTTLEEVFLEVIRR